MGKEKRVAVKVCLMGHGRIGRLWLQLLMESRKTECVSVVEPDRTNEIWKLSASTPPEPSSAPISTPCPPVYATLAEVKERYDVLWIAAPTDQHSAIISSVVAAERSQQQARFILCEPPIAESEAEVRKCYEACASRGIELMCGWQRRFDDGFVRLYDTSQAVQVTSATIVHKEGLEAGDSRGAPSLFRDLMSADFNLALMFMNEQMPVSVQATTRDTYGTGRQDSALCTLEYAGRRSVYIEVSMYGGREKYENSVRLVVNGGAAVLQSGKDDCPPEVKDCTSRYRQAWSSELSHFAKRCSLEPVHRRCIRDHCLATAQLVELAEQSAQMGSRIPVTVGPTLKLVQVVDGSEGEGTLLARHLKEAVLSELPFCQVVGVVGDEGDGSGNPLRLEAMLDRPDVDSVHVCLSGSYGTPQTQTECVETCLAQSKKLLCQAPLANFERLQRLAVDRDRFFMVAFYRRFDRQFQRAKELVTQLAADEGTLNSIVLESVQASRTPSLNSISRQAMDVEEATCILLDECRHDIDMVSWLLEDVDCEISVREITVKPGPSITIALPVWLRKYDRVLEAKIEWLRVYPNEVPSHAGAASQSRIVVNGGEPFGHSDSHEAAFDDAYQRMFKFFACQPGNVSGQGKYCSTYSRSFELLRQATERLQDVGADASNPQVVRGHSQLIPLEEMQTPFECPSSPRTAMQAAAAQAAKQAVEQHQGVAQEFRGVAGHGGMFTQGGKIYKPVVHEENECRVYEAIKEGLPELLPWVPRIYEAQAIVNGSPFLVMEDLTAGYQRPVVFDLKVGEPSDFYRMHNQPYALKVAGYTGDDIIRRSQQSWNDLVSYFKDYIKEKDTGNSRYEVIPDFLDQLASLIDIFQKQSLLKMRAVSLLFIYDGTDSAPQRPTVRIVDVARARILAKPPQDVKSAAHQQLYLNDGTPEVDHFFCFGLQNCYALLSSIHEKFINRHAVFLARHGLRETITAADDDSAGDALSVEGLQQAYDMAARLKHENITVVVSSPYVRAVQTAHIIAEQLSVKYVIEPAMADLSPAKTPRAFRNIDQEDPFLDKQYVPAGKEQPVVSGSQLCSQYKQMQQQFGQGFALGFPESQLRVYEALSKVCAKYKRVAIVAHASTFSALLSVLMGQPWQGPLHFASITSLVPRPGSRVGWGIERMNMSSHLTVFRSATEDHVNERQPLHVEQEDRSSSPSY